MPVTAVRHEDSLESAASAPLKRPRDPLIAPSTARALQRAIGNDAFAKLASSPAARMPDREAERRAGNDGTAAMHDVAATGVRLHDDAVAHRAARAVGARAFTVGSDVYLGSGVRGAGDFARILSHELSHAEQQREAGTFALQRWDGESSMSTSSDEAPVCEMPSSGPTVCAAGIVVPDDAQAEPGQMRQSDFLEEIRRRLNDAGEETLRVEGVEGTPAGEARLGDLYVAGIVQQSALTGKTIEQLVTESAQASFDTAESLIEAVVQDVPDIFRENRRAFLDMIAPTQEALEREARALEMDEDIRRPGIGGASSTWGLEPFGPFRNAEHVQSVFPEVDATLAAGLVHIPGSMWGPLGVLLQGLIFHAIISAGYVSGNPPPAHPAALINRGGGALGRKRTDLRDPVTHSVIEIKPKPRPGDIRGQAQLAAYVASLGPAWHAALNVPTEAWPVTGTFAYYALNPFGINFTLRAWNQFAAEPGMLYYELVATPGLPIYEPVHAPEPGRRFRFEFARIVLPDVRLPAPSPAVVAATTTTVGVGLLVLIAATLIPGVPPPP